MDPRGTIDRIYKEHHYTLLHTKCESSGPSGVGEKYIFFPIVSLCELIIPGAGPFLTPGTWLEGFIKRTTIHCYTNNMKAMGLVFRRRFFLCFSNEAPKAWPVWVPGVRLAVFIKRSTIHCYAQNIKALGFAVLEKNTF